MLNRITWRLHHYLH